MKKRILVAVILQLVIILTTTYKFGDIIKFRRSRLGLSYDHYAIYMGPESGVNVSQGQKDIFHNPGVGKRCQFGQLENERQGSSVKLFNYLDNIENGHYGNFIPGTTEEIRARITQLKSSCHIYELFCNNCENLATKVRYNISVTLQGGTDFEKLFVISGRAKFLLSQTRENMRLRDEYENMT